MEEKIPDLKSLFIAKLCSDTLIFSMFFKHNYNVFTVTKTAHHRKQSKIQSSLFVYICFYFFTILLKYTY